MIVRSTRWIGNLPLFKRLSLAAISAVLTLPVYEAGYRLGDIMNFVLIGGFFGALVLVPFVTSHAYRIVRIIILVISSILIYWLAVYLAIVNYGPLQIDNSVIVSGLLGAILVGIVVWVAAPLKVSWKFWIYVPLAGLFGGIIFQIIINNDYIIPQYASWQIPVCLSLHLGRANNFHQDTGVDTVKL
jgi:hypothetical protein